MSSHSAAAAALAESRARGQIPDVALETDNEGVLVNCVACHARNRLRFDSLDRETRCGQCKAPLPTVNLPVDITSGAHLRALIAKSSLPVLVDFWAEWCGPCKMVAPELEKVAASLSSKLIVGKLNTEEVPDIAAEFGISSIPSLVLMRNGKEISRLAGARPASDILRFVTSSDQTGLRNERAI